MKMFRLAAESKGYSFFYDRSLNFWCLTKENCETEYFSKYVLNSMGLSKFIQTYLKD